MKKKIIIRIIAFVIAICLVVCGVYLYQQEGLIVPNEDGSAYYIIDERGDILCDTPFAAEWGNDGNGNKYVLYRKIEFGKKVEKLGHLDNSFNISEEMDLSFSNDLQWLWVGDGYIVYVDVFPTTNLQILDYSFNKIATVDNVKLDNPRDVYARAENFIEVKGENGLFGIVNTKGEWVIEPQCSEFSEYYDGYIGACKDGLWGVMDKNGMWVIEPQYEKRIYCTNPYFAVTIKNDDYRDEFDTYFININGERLNDKKYYHIGTSTRFSEGLTYVAEGPEEEQCIGYIDATGEYVIEPQFYHAKDFNNGLAAVSKMIDGKEKWAYIDKNGNNVTDFVYDEAYEFSDDGYAVVEVDGKYGYIKKDGSWLLEPQFDRAGDFEFGYALVKLEKGQKIIK